MNAKELRAITDEIKRNLEVTKEKNAKEYVEEIVNTKLKREARLGLCQYQLVIPYQYDTSYVMQALEDLDFEVEYKGLGNLLVKW